MPPVDFVLIGGLAALVGAIVQGSVGLGWAFAGFLAAGPLRRFLDAGRLRAALLAVVGTSAVVLIVRNLV
ncbi:hypothetical protein GWI34_05040 [Actinomadura sp. DSM 109109]|nr:hypothetical protein [Actinomadura lepetitiana]